MALSVCAADGHPGDFPGRTEAMPANDLFRTQIAAMERLMWPLFLAFTAVGFVVMPMGWGEAEAREWFGSVPGLADAAARFLGFSDALWMVLAAIVVYLWLVRVEGLATARRWAATIMIGSAALEWVGAKTGMPFGPYAYTDRMGVRIAGVLPFTIPLAWFIVVITARAVILWRFPRARPLPLALGVGALALGTDLSLEWVAWKIRAYWIWYPGVLDAPGWPPVQNFVSWFVAAALFALAATGGRITPNAHQPARPALVLLIMNGMFWATIVVWLWRGA